jgi:3-hydroxyisobutyrate dehydrogenase-like beta-hydroxyacid dehydrogenase
VNASTQAFHSAAQVGVVGLGTMGSRIALRLHHQGVSVTGYNRTRRRGEALAARGVPIAASLSALAQQSDYILTALPGPAEVVQLLMEDGLLQHVRPDSMLVDLSTVDPDTARLIAQHAKAKGVQSLDAAMTGSTHAADTGTLGFLVGGEQAAVEVAKPLLLLIGAHVYHCGPSGAGCTAKLALNLLLAGMAQSLAEAFSLLGASGVSRELFLEALTTSALSSAMFVRIGQRALSDDLEPRFALAHLNKDLGLLVRLGGQLGLDMRLAAALDGIVGRVTREFAGADYASLITAELARSCESKSRLRMSS